MGGCSTILIFLIVIYVFVYEMYLMVIFSDYYHRQIETAANMEDIGIVSLDEMGTLPFFSVHYEGKRLKRTKDKHCSETDDDCMSLINKYLVVKWNNAR